MLGRAHEVGVISVLLKVLTFGRINKCFYQKMSGCSLVFSLLKTYSSLCTCAAFVFVTIVLCCRKTNKRRTFH